MKRLLFCVIALVFVLAACGNNSNKDSKSSSKDDNTIQWVLKVHTHLSLSTISKII